MDSFVFEVGKDIIIVFMKFGVFFYRFCKGFSMDIERFKIIYIYGCKWVD